MGVGDSYTLNGQLKASDAESREHQAALLAKRTVDIPHDLQIKIEYNADGTVKYTGYGAKGLDTDESGWLIHYMEYNASKQMTSKTNAYGTWDGRAGLSYE